MQGCTRLKNGVDVRLIDEWVITLFFPETILEDVKRVLSNLSITFEVKKESEGDYRVFW